MTSRYRKVLNRSTGRYVLKRAKSMKKKSRSRRHRSHNSKRIVIIVSPHLKKRNIRRSPSSSATLFSPGTIMIGNDGNEWKVKKVAGGVRRWIRL